MCVNWSILDTSVKNHIIYELNLEKKDGMMSMLIYENWMRSACMVCMYLSSIEYVTRNLK